MLFAAATVNNVPEGEPGWYVEPIKAVGAQDSKEEQTRQLEAPNQYVEAGSLSARKPSLLRGSCPSASLA